MNKRIGIGILGLTLVCGCGSAPQGQEIKVVERAPKPKQFTLDATLAKVGPRRVAVDVKTDLPDGTNVLVSVIRIYWERKDKDNEYAGDIFNKDLPVKDGKASIEVDVDDSIWVKVHNAKKEQFVPLGLWDEIGKVSPNITAQVLYSSMRDQPDSVKKILGSKGELMLQPGKSANASMTTIRVEKELSLPFKR